MQRATSVVRKAAVKQDRVVETLTLDHEDRNRRRVALKGDGGQEILLDLDKPTALNDGDAVRLEDGSLVLIKAAAQKLIEIKAENPLRLMRVAWHIGNRHTPAEITADAIYIEHDHVLAEIVRGQGCAMSEVEQNLPPTIALKRGTASVAAMMVEGKGLDDPVLLDRGLADDGDGALHDKTRGEMDQRRSTDRGSTTSITGAALTQVLAMARKALR